MLGKVTEKGEVEYEVKPVVTFVTVMGWHVAPVGTRTLSEVEVADVTFALTAPNHTTLFAGVVLKFVPVIVTVVPIGPEVGVKEVIVGGTAAPIVFLNTETVVLT